MTYFATPSHEIAVRWALERGYYVAFGIGSHPDGRKVRIVRDGDFYYVRGVTP